MLRIQLSILNRHGLLASVINDSDALNDSVDIVSHRRTQDAPAMCRKAAARLRELADAFERLSTMDKPCHEETHRKAMKP